jgi:nucleotide-binding universal stress UspA family protein
MADRSAGFQHIVVALDGGDEAWAAFDQALRLARSSNGRLDVLVADPAGPHGPGVTYTQIAESAVARAGSFPARTFVVTGDPAAAILGHAEQAHCDLIVMGCRSRIGSHPATSASTTTAVSDRCRVPVLMVRHITGDEEAAGPTRS